MMRISQHLSHHQQFCAAFLVKEGEEGWGGGGEGGEEEERKDTELEHDTVSAIRHG